MFRNYFKTAFRSLIRNKTYTTINVFGLAIGVAVCLVLFLVVQFELSFDKFHKNNERIYRIITQFNDADGINNDAGVPAPLPQTLRTDFPELEKLTAVLHSENNQVLITDAGGNLKKFKEEKGVFYTEPEFFHIFNFPWLAGDPKSLNEPNSIALTREIAEKYFGSWQSAIGKTIRLNNRRDLTVTGILNTIPPNTDFQIKMVTSFSGSRRSKSTDWASVSSDMGTYILVPHSFDVKFFNERLKVFGKKYKPADVKHIQLVQPLKEVHYDEDTGNFLRRTISEELIRGLLFIAAFILIIACVNFINLSTAQAINRAKEVGVRKVLGSSKTHLRVQFLTETFVIVLFSIVLALALTLVALPFVKNILQLPLFFSLTQNPEIIWLLLLLIPVIVLLAGFYPAIVLSRFNPIASLKSKIVLASTRGFSLRKVLVVLQFIIAQALIIGTLIIVLQMKYFRNKELGFNKEAILNVTLATDSASALKFDIFKNRLLQNPAVENVSFSYASPADQSNWYSNFKFDNAEKDTDWGANLKWADQDYLSTYGIQLIAGRNIKKSDTASEFIVNESFLKKFNITDPQQVLNKKLDFWNGSVTGEIVGIMKDFHAASLQDEIPPVVLGSAKENYYVAGIKLKA
ncbi:MAG TPA: ABC transporter permease, partial [Flavisolibacter sp.]|nr:ABC transporter permease [Flavisolibacter sp.]